VIILIPRDSTNALRQGYVYQIRNTINDEVKLEGKLPKGDKSTIDAALKEAIEWLDDNLQASKEEYEAQHKELEDAVNPILAKFYKPVETKPSADEEEEMPVHNSL
jgi:heat shock protein 5